MNKFLSTALALSLATSATLAQAHPLTYLSVEESRIDKAQQAHPEMTRAFAASINQFSHELNKVQRAGQLKSVIIKSGNALFLKAVEQLQQGNTFDDRPLYWARLQMAKLIRGNDVFRALSTEVQAEFIRLFEFSSRGDNDVSFNTKARKKILVTGFDPFFLDRNLAQSNPSGVAAMYLDGKVLELDGELVEVQSLMIPVRFADFDQGMIEQMLAERMPHVDMVATISMGREEFDLERFPGLRRSSKAPGNLNIYTGATSDNPLQPFLYGEAMTTPEFVEFSLPVKAMQKAKGPYQVIDNHKVETVAKGNIEPKTLDELQGQISVQGSGGGYLSNEISYRSIVLRDQIKPNLPVGHIHTPRIKQWQREEVKGIVLQIEDMLRQVIPTLK